MQHSKQMTLFMQTDRMELTLYRFQSHWFWWDKKDKCDKMFILRKKPQHNWKINLHTMISCFQVHWHHQWRSGSAFKTGRREMTGYIPGRACRPIRSKFSMIFSEIRVNTGQYLSFQNLATKSQLLSAQTIFVKIQIFM